MVQELDSGKLMYSSGNNMYFKDKIISGSDYHNQPHEIEAFELEGILYQDYLDDAYGVTPDEVSFFFPNRLRKGV